MLKNAEIIILDEPTTGLDPLMRDSFLEIIKEEHRKGKTIFMSSHMFEELEATCDRVALIAGGRIEHIVDMEDIRNPKVREYKVEFVNGEDYEKFKKLDFDIVRDQPKYRQVTVALSGDRINDLFRALKGTDVHFISEVKYNLDKYFREKLGRNKEADTHVQ